jgi:uncharacterized protein YndB with AHSA1/START domain
MWHAKHEMTAAVSPDRVWQLWSDVASWKAWNPDVRDCAVDGAFAAGSTVRMVLGDGTAVPLELVDVRAGRSFTDRAEIDGVVLTTLHTIEDAGTGQRITYALEVDGDAPEPVLAEIGGAVSADWPQTLAGLVVAAGG